ADWSRGAPIVLVCMARPEFLEGRPAWGGGKVNAVSMLLEPLTAQESGELIHLILGGGELSRQAQAAVLETSGGNPLFVEEVLANLIEEGLLSRESDRW